jgi:hypothetical protein
MDTVSLLALFASPALVAWLSKQAETWEWFGTISPNGKLSIIGGISVLLAIASLAAQQFLAGRPDVLGAVDPYVKIALPIVTFIVSQITHGSQTAKYVKGAN